MKLQLSLKSPKIDECLALLDEVYDYVDLVEIEYPPLIEVGLTLVRKVKATYPKFTVIADTKIHHSSFSSAHYITARCIDEGADAVTVMADASDDAIREAIKAASARGKVVAADMTGARGTLNRALQLEQMGVAYLEVPTGFTNKDGFPVKREGLKGFFSPGELALVKQTAELLDSAQVIALGGINQQNIADVAKAGASVALIGRAITTSANPKEAARSIKQASGVA